MQRFKLVPITQLPDWDSSCDSNYRRAIIECDADGNFVREVGCDGGEPEDNTFGRDWRWVLVELNKLADENDILKKAIAAAYPAPPVPPATAAEAAALPDVEIDSVADATGQGRC